MNFSELPWLGILLATVACLLVGFVWYHKKVFGTLWMNYNKLTEEDAKKANMGMIFGTTIVMSFIQSLFLAVIMSSHSMGGGFAEGACTGGFIGAAFVFTTYFIDHAFEMRPSGLAFLNGMNKIICLAIQGGIIGVMMG